MPADLKAVLIEIAASNEPEHLVQRIRRNAIVLRGPRHSENDGGGGGLGVVPCLEG